MKNLTQSTFYACIYLKQEYAWWKLIVVIIILCALIFHKSFNLLEMYIKLNIYFIKKSYFSLKVILILWISMEVNRNILTGFQMKGYSGKHNLNMYFSHQVLLRVSATDLIKIYFQSSNSHDMPLGILIFLKFALRIPISNVNMNRSCFRN